MTMLDFTAMVHFLGGLVPPAPVVDSYVIGALIALGYAYLAFGLDDLFIDLWALTHRIKPKFLNKAELDSMEARPERALAVIVPAWKEANIIKHMLVGNLERIAYKNVHFFVGVYPNDPKTGDEVRAAAKSYPQIHAIDNDRDGPTSKGQILNYVIQQIRIFELERGSQFDAIIMHDSEDVIHRLAFRLMNRDLDRFDFVQIPVFSLSVEMAHLVAGTYMDEFAELHTKDLLVRECLGAAVPSAGVGTAMSRTLVTAMLASNNNELFRESALTEDYDLGIRVKSLGFRSHFSSCYFADKNTKNYEFVATREYFPKRFTRSIRQKTRWTIGIALQGWRNLGWMGGVADRYFLGRDRKGICTNVLSLMGYPIMLYLVVRQISDHSTLIDLQTSVTTRALLATNIGLMSNRLIQRMICVNRVYGFRAILPVAVRWPIGNIINAFACIAAVKSDILAHWNHTTIAWSKTEHELPAAFGGSTEVPYPTAPQSSNLRSAGIRLLLSGIACASFSQKAIAVPKCVQVYYDAVPNNPTPYYFGRQHSIMLQNLLGHFPHIQQYISPMELYTPGDIERCETTIYLGTHFHAKITPEFQADFIKTQRNVVWAGYGIWKLGNDNLDKLWGVHYKKLATLDTDHRDAKGRPGFFRNYDYKGETFIKYGEYDRINRDRFNAGFEITLFDAIDTRMSNYVISWAHHNTQNSTTPYILRNGNHWYIGDSPFSFTTEEDRYLIFADLLFDILDEKPRRTQGPKPAFLRFEDIHPRVDQWQLYRMVNKMEELKVKFCMTLVPIFVDPFGLASDDPADRYVPLTRNSTFRDFLKYAGDRGVGFIFHGVTHQGGFRRNPFTGVTGHDFEFWDRVANKPMPNDSPRFVVERLEDGLSLFNEVGIKPFAWLSPHYQASPLDYVIFGQLFRWNVGRIIYFPFQQTQARHLPVELAMDVAGAAGNQQRLPYFKDLVVDYPKELLPTGQFYPYEIFWDAYGQRIIPENIGNIQPFMNEQVFRTETITDLIAGFRRNRVIRDSWGSFFFHPFMLNATSSDGIGTFPGDLSKLEMIIKAARDYGYEFIDVKAWADANVGQARLPPIVRTINSGS